MGKTLEINYSDLLLVFMIGMVLGGVGFTMFRESPLFHETVHVIEVEENLGDGDYIIYIPFSYYRGEDLLKVRLIDAPLDLEEDEIYTVMFKPMFLRGRVWRVLWIKEYEDEEPDIEEAGSTSLIPSGDGQPEVLWSHLTVTYEEIG